MTRKIIYLLFGGLLLVLRLVFNFSYELIPGINGGYYPLQIRTVLESGRLGFPDMPLYFYLNAGLVRLASFFTVQETDVLILWISKAVDSVSLPLLVIPLYFIGKRVWDGHLPLYVETFLVGFATLSFAPLALTSDLQKNAFAIPLMLGYLYFLLVFYKTRSKLPMAGAAFFLILTGLTHFGAFAVSGLFLLLSLLLFYRKKAWLPMLGGTLLSVMLVMLFDSSRAERLLNGWALLFEHPLILQGRLAPPDGLSYLFSYLLVGLGSYQLIKYRVQLSAYGKNSLVLFLGVLFLLAFPLTDQEYARRFSLFLFIPQVILAGLLYKCSARPGRVLTSFFLLIIPLLSVLLMAGNRKPPVISQAAFQDLKNLEGHIAKPESTLIVARHGLEWWTAWQLRTKVGQEKAVDEATLEKYDPILVLTQRQGINAMKPGEPPFPEPNLPTESAPIYRSVFFKVAELKKTEMDTAGRQSQGN